MGNEDGDLYNAFDLMSQGHLGGFAKCLAEAWFVADSTNRAKIETTWSELIARATSQVKYKGIYRGYEIVQLGETSFRAAGTLHGSIWSAQCYIDELLAL